MQGTGHTFALLLIMPSQMPDTALQTGQIRSTFPDLRYHGMLWMPTSEHALLNGWWYTLQE